MGEKGRTLGKTCVIKARCYWEHPWEIHWELEMNKGKTKKILLPSLPLPQPKT
jgi:hypothetical protein